ncbi:MAG: hypothetical protein ACI80F_000430 [Natronomonas sp.]|jgi:hypothetical protein
MDIDGDDLRERLDIDLGDARARADELYEYAFLPPSVTNDELNEQIEPATEEFADAEFDFTEWLDEGADAPRTAEPTAPEPVETAETAETVMIDPAGFEFDDWVRAGDTELDLIEPEPEADESVETDVPDAPDQPSPSIPRPKLGISVHPAKAATFALFLAVVALSALSASGILPTLGPAAGL